MTSIFTKAFFLRRVPKEKRIVLDEVTKDTIWWGDVNIPINVDSHKFCRDLALKYLNQKPRVLIFYLSPSFFDIWGFYLIILAKNIILNILIKNQFLILLILSYTSSMVMLDGTQNTDLRLELFAVDLIMLSS